MAALTSAQSGNFTASARINMSEAHEGVIFSNYHCYGQYPMWTLRTE